MAAANPETGEAADPPDGRPPREECLKVMLSPEQLAKTSEASTDVPPSESPPRPWEEDGAESQGGVQQLSLDEQPPSPVSPTSLDSMQDLVEPLSSRVSSPSRRRMQSAASPGSAHHSAASPQLERSPSSASCSSRARGPQLDRSPSSASCSSKLHRSSSSGSPPRKTRGENAEALPPGPGPLTRSDRRVSVPNLADVSSGPGAYSRLQAIREAFSECCVARSGVVKVGDLARWWATAAESKSALPLTVEERGLIAADVQRFFEQADVYREGKVSIDQWLHFALLEAQSPGPAALAAIANALQELDDASAIPRIVQMWIEVDTRGVGLVHLGSLAASLNSTDRSFEAEDMVTWLEGDMGRRVTYAEFCARQAGLEHHPVELWYYDMSKSLAKFLAPVLLGRQEEGVWHTSLVVFGQEFFFFGGIKVAKPGETPFGKPTKKLRLGSSLRTESELSSHIRYELDAKFTRQTYDIFSNNCNHCCDALALFLLGRHIPNQVRLLSDRLMGTPLARLVRPILNKYLSGKEEPAVNNKDGKDPEEAPEGGGENAEAPAPEEPKLPPASRAVGAGASATGDVVLYDHPGSLVPVVARIVGTPAAGLCDLCWLDKAGRRRVSRGVKLEDLKPYRALSSEKDSLDEAMSFQQQLQAAWAKEVYAEALGAMAQLDRQGSSFSLSGESPGRQASKATSDSRQQAPKKPISSRSVGLTTWVSESSAVLQCSDGHQWRPKHPRSHWPMCLRGPHCSRCDRTIRGRSLWMGCTRCKRISCEECWEARRDAADGSPNVRARGNATLTAEEASPRRRCRRGHALERLSGQAFRAGASCRRCGTKELGATFPFFLSCRLCGYDLCPLCIDVPSAAAVVLGTAL